MDTMASKINSLTIVYSTVYSGADQRKNQSSASLAFVRGIHRGPVNFPHKWPVTRKMFPFDDVIMQFWSMSNLDPNVSLPVPREPFRLFKCSKSGLELNHVFGTAVGIPGELQKIGHKCVYFNRQTCSDMMTLLVLCEWIPQWARWTVS